MKASGWDRALYMNIGIFFKASAIWVLMAILAIVNGIFRERILVPGIGHAAALPTSGFSLSCIIFVLTYFVFPLFGKRNMQTYFLIGLQWLLMTLFFEIVLGHYVMAKSWSTVFEVFNIMNGNLFIIVLLTTLFSPLIIAKIKFIAKIKQAI